MHEPPRAALAIAGRADAEKRNEYLFDTGDAFPVDRLRFALPQVNAVAPFVLPGYREGAPLAAAVACLGALASNPAAASAPPKVPADSVKTYFDTPEGRKNVLWGVLFVIWMATCLMREMGGGPQRKETDR